MNVNKAAYVLGLGALLLSQMVLGAIVPKDLVNVRSILSVQMLISRIDANATGTARWGCTEQSCLL